MEIGMKRATKVALIVAGGALALSGCERPQTQTQTAAAAEPEFRLPVSLNEVMVAMVNQAADPLWVAAWRNPGSDAEWRELERRAYQLQLAGVLLKYPGTGPQDDEWAGDAGWRAFADQIRDIGANAVSAVQARNLGGISKVGDDLVEVCEACHKVYKPDIPTAGKFGELSPTAQDFEEQ